MLAGNISLKKALNKLDWVLIRIILFKLMDKNEP